MRKGKVEDLLELLRRWQKSGMAAKRFMEHIRIVEVLKPETSPGKTERAICTNSTVRRFHRRVEMVYLVRLVDLNRVVEVIESPTAMTQKAKVTISELILRKRITD